MIPCYVDGERDLARLVDDEMRDAKLAIAPDARAALVSLIGGDRQASRSEIRKLALYAHGQDRVVLDDVLAVVADASALALDAVIDAAFAGRAPEAETQFARALAAGTSAGTILAAGAAPRHAVAQGAGRRSTPAPTSTPRSVDSFRRCISAGEPQVEAAVKSWTAQRLARAMEQLADASRDIRELRAPIDGLAEPMAQRALLSIATAARRRPDQRRTD